MKHKIVGLLLALVFVGPRYTLADIVLPFEGQVDFTKKQLEFILKFDQESFIKAKAVQHSHEGYYLSINLDHIKALAFDVSTQLESSLEIKLKEDGTEKVIAGKIWSQYSLFDYKPIRELFGEFKIQNKRLEFTSLSIGNVGCEGYIDLVYPHKMNVSLDLDSVELTNFLSFWADTETLNSQGYVSGKIKVAGALDYLNLRGSLESFDGEVDELKFDSFYLNFEGVYPVIQVAGSQVSETNGMSYSVDGLINLREKNGWGKQIESLSIIPVVYNSDNKTEWTIKRFNKDEAGITEFKYLLKKSGGPGSSELDTIDMLGVQKTLEF